jgi:hypothetical protein
MTELSLCTLHPVAVLSRPPGGTQRWSVGKEVLVGANIAQSDVG